MKKQSGFTLIELLLVLAIIGIISAIAIPALLSQRSRARDKAAISNMTGRIGDLIGQYDKNKEAGMASTAMSAALQTYLNNTAGADKNPWDPATAAFSATAVATSTTGSTAALMATDVSGAATVLGQPVFKIFYPTATQPGFIGGAVLVQNTQTSGTKKVIKVSSIE